MLRQMDNEDLFQIYDSDLVLRLHNAKNLADTWKILARFKENLGDNPPSPKIVKSFLARYADRKPRTLYRYAQMLRVFMKWYGEPMIYGLLRRYIYKICLSNINIIYKKGN